MSVPPEVVGRLDRYRPSSLSGREWTLAGPAVRAAVLAAAGQPAGPRLADAPDLSTLDPGVAEAIVSYRPERIPARRRELSFVVGLGLGAGLDGRDLRHVARDGFSDVDLGETSPGLAVTVAGGDRPRSVVVRRAYELLVREALASHDAARRGRTASILGRSQSRRNITTPVMEHAVTARATEMVAIEVNRPRATWLVAAMCAPIPLGVLLAAAGLRSARSLCDLLSHCPAPDPAVVAAALAHLDHAGIGQGQDRP